MFYDFWTFCHNIGLHFYALPTMVVALATGVTALVHHINQKRRDQKAETDALNEFNKNN